MSDLERPTTPWLVKVTGVIALVLLGWLLFGSALTIVRAAIALIGYVVVGFVAFTIGKAVGKRQ